MDIKPRKEDEGARSSLNIAGLDGVNWTIKILLSVLIAGGSRPTSSSSSWACISSPHFGPCLLFKLKVYMEEVFRVQEITVNKGFFVGKYFDLGETTPR